MTEEDEMEMMADWSDYRKEYGAPTSAFEAFKAGWKAGRHGDQSSVMS